MKITEIEPSDADVLRELLDRMWSQMVDYTVAERNVFDKLYGEIYDAARRLPCQTSSSVPQTRSGFDLYPPSTPAATDVNCIVVDASPLKCESTEPAANE